jgi:hypothetical protein
MRSDNSALDFILQTDLKQFIASDLGKEAWITVYHSFQDDSKNGAIFCALVPRSKLAEVLDDSSWELSIGNGLPSCVERNDGDEDVVLYERFGNSDGIEPLVIKRVFHDLKPSYLEIVEEFRLFHNLYHDVPSNSYLSIDNGGSEEEIVRVESENTVRVKVKALRQFLALKDMYFVIYFDIVQFSMIPPREFDSEEIESVVKGDDFIYSFHIDSAELASDTKKSFSRLLGKKVILPFSKEKSGKWPYDDRSQRYVEFIIGVNDNGDNIVYSCKPSDLANNFGANRHAPDFLTPVFFRREVLNKYYAHPEKYSVEDSYLRCGSLWVLRLDNNHERYVVVFLGDLGQILPYQEQQYWASFNVPPDGGISRVYYQRSIMGEFADPESADLLFKQHFESFQRSWFEKFEWYLFQPLEKGDQHLFASLHLPLTNDQAEFDNQTLAIAKILIDSLNEKELARQVTKLPADAKGITKFQKFLESQNLKDSASVISFLRNLWDLRSTGIGHRKGENYQKAAAVFGIGQRDLGTVFDGMLRQAILMMDILEEHFLLAS